MRKIPVSTIFVLIAVPFILITIMLMVNNREPVGVPSCYKELICDTLQILDDSKRSQIGVYQKDLLDQYDIDLRVLTGNMSAADTINYFNTVGVGKKSESNQGALLMVDPQSALIRFHVAPVLRNIYTNDFTAYIEAEKMVPFFRDSKVSTGVVSSAQDVLTRAQEASAGTEFSPVNYKPSGVQEDAGSATSTSNSAQLAPAVPDIPRPTEVVAEYQRMLMANNAAYNLPLYSKASKLLRQRVPMTAEEMKQELLSHKPCEIFKEVVLSEGLAAVLYNVNQRQCRPYLLVFEDGAWRLDVASMASHFTYNAAGEWLLVTNKPLIYKDAFLDWQIGANGVPRPLPRMRWGLLVDSDINARITYIKKIYDGTAAAEMPFQAKDVILAWDGLNSPTNIDVEKSMETAEGGQKINVMIWRNGQRYVTEIEAPPKLN